MKIKLFSVGLLAAFMIMTDTIAFFGTTWLADIAPTSFFSDSVIPYIATIISKLMLFIITKTIGSFRKKNNTRLPFLYWIALLLFPAVSSMVIFQIFLLTYLEDITVSSALSLFEIIGLLFVNILAFQFFESLLEKTSLEMRERLMQQQMEAQIAQYEAVISEQQSRRRFLHDLKNNIELIHNLIRSGNADEALKCMSKIVELSAIDKEFVHTGNAVIDALFNSKVRLAGEKGTRVEIEKMLIPSDIALDPTDMCVLFANSLDNAIEACDRITEGDKYIIIGLALQNESLAYKISNPTDGKLVKDKKHFITSKKIAGIHGLGIENMARTLEKYDGVLSVEHSGNMFELRFVIPHI